jgi:hypothetical protein
MSELKSISSAHLAIGPIACHNLFFIGPTGSASYFLLRHHLIQPLQSDSVDPLHLDLRTIATLALSLSQETIASRLVIGCASTLCFVLVCVASVKLCFMFV